MEEERGKIKSGSTNKQKGKTVLSIVHAIVRAIVAQPRHIYICYMYVGFLYRSITSIYSSKSSSSLRLKAAQALRNAYVTYVGRLRVEVV